MRLDTWADGASGGVAKYVRLVEVTYPNGRQVHYDYGAAGAIDDVMSRLGAFYDDADSDDEIDLGEDVYASYRYLGAGRIVTEDYEDIDVKLDYSANNFAALDRFGRVVDQLWLDHGADPDVTLDRYTYTYDRAGNRTSRTNETKLDGSLDEEYLYDDLDRLSEWKLNDVSQKTWDNFDGLGNDLDTGTYNAANEMTPTQGSSGYDAAGNMTTLQSGDTAVYDAWNRLVEVDDGQTIVERNEFDGTNRRIQVFSDFDGATPDKVVDDYHAGVQTIESDVTVDGNRDGGYQTIWSPRYIDSAILRDTLNTAGTAIVAADRVFYLADANYNVTGLVQYNPGTTDWEVAERYTYTPYGEVSYRTAAWTTTGSSANTNTTLYTGRELDLLTNLYYYRARYYDAHLERFVGRDPIGYKANDANVYRYCGNGPMSHKDPMGLYTAPPVWPADESPIVPPIIIDWESALADLESAPKPVEPRPEASILLPGASLFPGKFPDYLLDMMYGPPLPKSPFSPQGEVLRPHFSDNPIDNCIYQRWWEEGRISDRFDPTTGRDRPPGARSGCQQLERMWQIRNCERRITIPIGGGGR